MNRAEAAKVLDTLCAGYPFVDLDAATIDAWVTAIAQTGADPATAQAIAQRWSAREARFPALADVVAVMRPRPTVDAIDADRWVEPHPDVVRRMLDMARVALASADTAARAATAENVRRGMPPGSSGHWHGGPLPCGRCSYVPPRSASSQRTAGGRTAHGK